MTEISQQDQPRKIPKGLSSPFRQKYEEERKKAEETLLKSGINPRPDIEASGNDAQALKKSEEANKQAKKSFEKARQNFAKELTAKGIEGEIDPLTGLLNRRGFYTRMDYVTRMMRRDSVNTFIVMLDVNDLKKVNDSDKTRHEMGDNLLKTTAQCMEQTVRITDVLARWGGDEFLIALVGTNNMEGVLDFWRRLNKEFSKKGIKISVGASQLELDPKNIRSSIDKAIDNADKRMILAKKQSKKNDVNWITTSN